MSNHAKETFGRAAVRLGYVSDAQVTRALTLQRENTAAGLPHKLIGMIMLEIGALGTTELISILRELNAPMAPAADSGSAS
jgi:hypothetical protein